MSGRALRAAAGSRTIMSFTTDDMGPVMEALGEMNLDDNKSHNMERNLPSFPKLQPSTISDFPKCNETIEGRYT